MDRREDEARTRTGLKQDCLMFNPEGIDRFIEGQAFLR